jgi:endoglucanase
MAAYPTGVRYRGLNRAGAEYGDDWDGWTGQTFYDVPTPATWESELAYYDSRGFNAVRFPISWERLQQSLNGPLDGAYVNEVVAAVEQATTAGWLIILDLHNYNRYAQGAFDAAGNQAAVYQQRIFGDGFLDTSHLVDVWTKMAGLFLDEANVVFAIMNEPHDFPVTSDTWFSNTQSVINAIREAGAQQLILVPNSRGSDVDHWSTYAPNGGSLDSVAALLITDSGNNYAFDMHAYQDNPDSATSYVDLLTTVTEWAKNNGKQLFLSELGIQNGAANGEVALGNLLDYLNSNNDVWVGWTTWNLAPYNITSEDSYTTDGPEMAWYTSRLNPNTVSGRP